MPQAMSSAGPVGGCGSTWAWVAALVDVPGNSDRPSNGSTSRPPGAERSFGIQYLWASAARISTPAAIPTPHAGRRAQRTPRPHGSIGPVPACPRRQRTEPVAASPPGRELSAPHGRAGAARPATTAACPYSCVAPRRPYHAAGSDRQIQPRLRRRALCAADRRCDHLTPSGHGAASLHLCCSRPGCYSSGDAPTWRCLACRRRN
jgi:hypothetical protein